MTFYVTTVLTTAINSDKTEQEADALASDAQLPAAELKKHKVTNADDVKQLAKMLEISPCIIAGRLR